MVKTKTEKYQMKIMAKKIESDINSIRTITKAVASTEDVVSSRTAFVILFVRVVKTKRIYKLSDIFPFYVSRNFDGSNALLIK